MSESVSDERNLSCTTCVGSEVFTKTNSWFAVLSPKCPTKLTRPKSSADSVQWQEGILCRPFFATSRFFETHSTVRLPDGPVTIRPFQIIVWVSLHPMGRPILPENAARFPAILDLGHSHNFSITEFQLSRWAGLSPNSLQVLGSVKITANRLPLLGANIWIHSNRSGERDQFSDQPPFCIPLDSGIALYPHETPHAPRLPLLGLRGLRRANLQLHVDCQHCSVSLRTPKRLWFF